MGTIFVARSANLSQWGSDVGISKHIYKLGYTEAAVKDVVAAGWAGMRMTGSWSVETGWRRGDAARTS